MARIVKGPDGIQHSFPDDATDAEIGAALEASQVVDAPINRGSIRDLHGPGAVKVGPLTIGPRDVERGYARLLSWLPVAGGVAGDLAGGAMAAAATPTSGGASLLAAPAAMAGGAAVGQAAGRGLELAGRRVAGLPLPENVEPTAGGVARDVAGQAGWGAASSLVGQAGSGILKAAARPLMASAMRTTNAAAVDAALKEGVRPGRSLRTGKTGSEQVAERVGSAIEKQSASLAEASKPVKTTKIVPTQVPVSPVPITEAADIFMSEARASSAIADAARRAGMEPEALKALLRERSPNPLDLAEAQRRGLDARALASLREMVPAIERADQLRNLRQTVGVPTTVETRISMDTGPLFKRLEKVVSTAEKRGAIAPEMASEAATLRARFDAFREAVSGGRISPNDAQMLKEVYADMARTGYQLSEKGQPVRPLSAGEIRYARAIADEARAWLKANVKGYAEPTATLARLQRLAPKMAAGEDKVRSPHLGLLMNPLNLAPQGAVGQAALTLNGPLSGAARWSPWLLDQSASASRDSLTR